MKPSLWHRMICRLGLCGGYVDHEQDKNGDWWIGLRCTNTGKLHDPVRSTVQDKKKK